MPKFGWESIFWFAGFPLLLLPIMLKQLPETTSYLIRTGQKEKLIATLSKVSPESTFNLNDEIVEVKTQETKVPIIGLFKEKRALSTVMFWIAFFSCLLMVYGLNTWLPKLMIEAGYGLNSSLGFLIALQGGAIIGTLIIGRLCDQYGSKKMLVPMYASVDITRFWRKFIFHLLFSSHCRSCDHRFPKYCPSLCFPVLSSICQVHCFRDRFWYRQNWRYGRTTFRRIPFIDFFTDSLKFYCICYPRFNCGYCASDCAC